MELKLLLPSWKLMISSGTPDGDVAFGSQVNDGNLSEPPVAATRPSMEQKFV